MILPRFAVLLGFFACAVGLDARTWTDTTGREVKGDWVSSDAQNITLRLATGKTVTFPLSRLADGDREHAAKLAAANRHPANWKPLRIHLEHIEEEPRAVGMPGAFHRIDSHSWEADLPVGAWVRIDCAAGAFGGISHLLQWKGASEWHFDTEGAFLYRRRGSETKQDLVGVSLGSYGGASSLPQPLKEEFTKLLGEVGPVESVSGVMLAQVDPVADLLRDLDPIAVTVQVDHRNDFSALTRLRRLKALYFHVGQIQSFDNLADLDGVECLDTGNAFTSTLNDAGPLAAFRRLKFLETSMRGSGDAAAFGGLSSIEALELRCHDPQSLETLTRLPRLHTLGGFTTPPGLVRSLPGLVRLGCRIDEKAADGKPLEMPKLTSLRFASAEQIAAWKKAGGLEFLHEIENLSGDLGSLTEMGALRHVGLSCYGDKAQSGDGGAKALRTLHVKGDSKSAKQVWKSQKNLQGLHLEVWTGPASLELLQAPPTLQWLSLHKIPELSSLAGIERFSGLRYLKLEKLDVLEDARSLSSLRALQGLRLEALPLLKRLSFAGLSKMTDVRLTGLTKVDSIQQVSAAGALRRANINTCPGLLDWSDWGRLSELEDFYLISRSQDMDLEEIAGLDSLKQVDFVGVKLRDKQRLKLFTKTGEALVERAKTAAK